MLTMSVSSAKTVTVLVSAISKAVLTMVVSASLGLSITLMLIFSSFSFKKRIKLSLFPVLSRNLFLSDGQCLFKSMFTACETFFDLEICYIFRGVPIKHYNIYFQMSAPFCVFPRDIIKCFIFVPITIP